MAMQPVLSWLVFASFVGAAYCIFFGVPRQLMMAITDTTKSNTLADTKTPSKRDSRALRKPISKVAKKVQSNIGKAIKTVEPNAIPLVSPQPEEFPVQLDRHPVNTAKVESWYNRNGISEGVTGDGEDPVAAVMSGRPRKTSTPIGRQSLVEKSRNAHHIDTEDNGEYRANSPAHLTEAQFQKSKQAHINDDMLDRDTSYVARTLKIVGTSSAEPSKPVSKTHDTALTKKQRQNAAKKAKAKAERAEIAAQQAAALHVHQREVERRRIVEIAERDKRQQQSSKDFRTSVWKDDDWTTVSKSKSKAANGQAASVDPNGKLIWE